MKVRAILSQKATDGIVTVPPGVTVAEAAEVLAAHRIGTVVVSEDGRLPSGILSERDIVGAIGREGASVLERKVSEVMTAEPKTAGCEDAAEEVLRRMTDGRFRHLPVIEDGALVGMVSLGDVVKARLEEAETERAHLEEFVAGR